MIHLLGVNCLRTDFEEIVDQYELRTCSELWNMLFWKQSALSLENLRKEIHQLSTLNMLPALTIFSAEPRGAKWLSARQGPQFNIHICLDLAFWYLEECCFSFLLLTNSYSANCTSKYCDSACYPDLPIKHFVQFSSLLKSVLYHFAFGWPEKTQEEVPLFVIWCFHTNLYFCVSVFALVCCLVLSHVCIVYLYLYLCLCVSVFALVCRLMLSHLCTLWRAQNQHHPKQHFITVDKNISNRANKSEGWKYGVGITHINHFSLPTYLETWTFYAKKCVDLWQNCVN